MKRVLLLMSAVISSFAVVPAAVGVTSASAAPLGVFISNTPLSSNIGLTFCTPTTVKGCIESISVDGNELTPVSSFAGASYGIGGGLYSGPCRFIGTTVSQCEYPYMVLYPMPGAQNMQRPLNNVQINFRRQLNSHPTSSIGAAIVNGSLQSFTPAAPGVRDVASINANTVEVHSASTGYCLGWVMEIDTCSIGDVATSKVSNRVAMLLLPAMRSSVVPPDAADETCRALYPMNTCLINIFDEASRGGWVDTDASVFGLTSMDRNTGAAQLKIAGPHLKAAVNGTSELNLSNFRMFLTSGYLNNSFGLTPAQANGTTLAVKRTTTESSTRPVTQYIPSAEGLLVSSTGIGFSVPTISVQRTLVVKRNKKLTTDALLKAAGVFQTKQFGAAKITINKKHGMKYAGKRYSFSKKRTVLVNIRYKSSKTTFSVRQLTIKVL
jgi:hypothetical protein